MTPLQCMIVLFGVLFGAVAVLLLGLILAVMLRVSELRADMASVRRELADLRDSRKVEEHGQ